MWKICKSIMWTNVCETPVDRTHSPAQRPLHLGPPIICAFAPYWLHCFTLDRSCGEARAGSDPLDSPVLHHYKENQPRKHDVYPTPKLIQQTTGDRGLRNVSLAQYILNTTLEIKDYVEARPASHRKIVVWSEIRGFSLWKHVIRWFRKGWRMWILPKFPLKTDALILSSKLLAHIFTPSRNAKFQKILRNFSSYRAPTTTVRTALKHGSDEEPMLRMGTFSENKSAKFLVSSK